MRNYSLKYFCAGCYKESFCITAYRQNYTPASFKATNKSMTKVKEGEKAY